MADLMGRESRLNTNPLKGMGKMRAQIVITVHEDGRLSVNGPLHDKLQCYGMLELAKQVVADWKPEDEPRVQPATPEETSKLVMP